MIITYKFIKNKFQFEKKTFGFSGKSPLKLNRINSDKLNDKALSQLKTSLFELKDENVELSLEEVIDTSSSTNIILANSQEDAYNDLHGRWLIISGNKLKKEAVHKSSNRKSIWLLD